MEMGDEVCKRFDIKNWMRLRQTGLWGIGRSTLLVIRTKAGRIGYA